MTNFLLIAVGLVLSAFFSGSETGFYRAGRLRLALDARQGDMIARALIWLTNNPSLFVATTLVGNNLANYLTSLGILLATHALLGEGNFVADLVTPMAATPFIFVYGELLPKTLFYIVPNRLLRRVGPVFLFFTVLFVPISCVLWLLGRLLQMVLGASHIRVRQNIARHEFQRILTEGRDAGLLGSSQTQLAQTIFEASGNQVQQLSVPVTRVPSVSYANSRDEVIEIGRRNRASELVVRGESAFDLVGYVRLADVLLTKQEWRNATRKLPAVRFDDSALSAMVRMRSRGDSMSEIVDLQGRTLGVLPMVRLLDSLLRQPA